MDLPGRVHAFAQQHELWSPQTEVIAAVSGGADSVALLFVLQALGEAGKVRLVGVAHLNHRLRGRDAEADAEFVRGLADRLALPLFLHAEDVGERAARQGESIEVAGRHARLEFFERLASAAGSPRIALAHTRTDQAETVLLRLARGAGGRGLAGMAARTGHRIRPLLEESRTGLRDWLRERGEGWREDLTNANPAIARNLVRLDIMPRLAQLNPGVEAALARAARIQRSDAELLDQLAEAEAARLLGNDAGKVQFSMSAVRALPDALARRVVRLALLRIHPNRTPSADDTEIVLRCSAGPLEVAAARLELIGDSAVLSSREQTTRRAPLETAAARLVLNVPGSAAHPRGWWTVDADGPLPRHEVSLLAGAGSSPTTEAARAVVDAAAVGRHLTIRGWEPGDRLQPLGLGGRKKVQDVFVDRKVPREERGQVPIVVDSSGRIVWVAGHVVGEPFRVTPRSEAVVVLTLRH